MNARKKKNGALATSPRPKTLSSGWREWKENSNGSVIYYSGFCIKRKRFNDVAGE
jgi:hypothetical protein